MSVALLLLTFAMGGIGSKIFSKLCSNMINQNSAAKYSIVLIINSIVACLFFTFSSGFKISVNRATAIYSLLYAFVVAVSIIANIIVYKYASISNVNVVSNACGMVCTAVIGFMLFSEKATIEIFLRIAIMIIAIIFVFFDQKRQICNDSDKQQNNRRSLIPLILIITIITAALCANTVILKLFAISPSVTDENSFFFFTNVILCIGAAITFAIACLREKSEFKSSINIFYPKKLISIAGNTVCSNITSLISILIVAQMDVSLFSPLSSAIAIIVGLIGSLLFREKLGAFSYIAAALACVAVII